MLYIVLIELILMVSDYMSEKFENLDLRKELLEGLKVLKFTEMTPVQSESLPVALKGSDVIAQAKTGSGKTAAFGLAILNSLDIKSRGVHSLVLCPTRELAEQVAAELRMLARGFANVKIVALCGGSSKSLQQKALSSGANIVVGTPGRVLFHLKKENLKLEPLSIFTLDEADRMLDMGFRDEILDIVEFLPKKRQTLLFSATYPENIQSLSSNVQNDPVEVKIELVHEQDTLKQIFFKLKPGQDRNALLFKLLCVHRPSRAIVFCKTKADTNNLAEFLYNRGIHVGCINGDLDQNERTEVLEKFANESLSILVATDVAARGLDIEDLPAVINYSMPLDADAYVHRIGRAGRAGKKGLAFSFFEERDQDILKSIESKIQIKCEYGKEDNLSYSKKYDLTPPMETIYISGGKRDKLRAGDIVGALVGDAGLNASAIGKISMHNSFCFVAVQSKALEESGLIHGSVRVKKKNYKTGRL